MKIKNVIKVMNFHALLRVDSSKKTAEKYFEYEKSISDFMDNILNNKNLILDQKTVKLNKKAKPLNIYIGNDLGFCGGFNTNVNSLAIKEKDADKIIIGKKIIGKKDNVLMSMTKEEYIENDVQIEECIYDIIQKGKNSEINIIYNHYHNISNIEFTKKKVLPIDKDSKEKTKIKYNEDFTVEGNIQNILVNLIALYISYEIKIAVENSYASENIMRQRITSDSLKKIDEIEEEKDLQNRKKIKNMNFKKVVENFVKIKSKEE